MSDLYASGVLAAVLVSYKPEREDRPDLDVEGWRRALAAPPGADPDDVEIEWAVDAYPRLQAYSISGALDDVLSLKPPTRDELLALGSMTPADAALIREYTWIVDRTAGVPLERWARTALHFEYRWQEGKLPSPVPIPLMDAVQVDLHDLRRVIAHDAVYSQFDEDSNHFWRLHNGMYHQAKSFLLEGRHAEASALYEYLLSQRPSDPGAANNLGFCLLPLEPRRALALFDRAKENGYENTALLLYNRLCAEGDEDRLGGLLVEIEHYWSGALSENPHSCTVWVPEGNGRFELSDTVDVRVDLAREMAIVYRARGRYDRVEIWSQRLAQVQGLDPSDPGAIT